MSKSTLRSRTGRYRLHIFRSNKHIYAQLIDDTRNIIITSSSSTSCDLRKRIRSSKTCETAKLIGKDIAKKLQAQGIYSIIFDRDNKIYHGRIKALAEAARNAGIDL